MQRLAVSNKSCCFVNNSVVDGNAATSSNTTQKQAVQAVKQLLRLYACCQLQHQAAGLQGKEAVCIVERLDKFKAQAIAKAHGADESCNTALLDCGRSHNLACFHSLVYGGQVGLEHTKIQYLGIITRAGQEDNLVACCLKVSRNSLIAVDNAYSERYQCRRNCFIHKGTAHAVLAADRRQIQCIQCSKRT